MIAVACWRRSIAFAISGAYGQVADARFDHFDAGLDSRAWISRASRCDTHRRTAERELALVVGVVREARGKNTDGRFGLHVDEVLVVIHLENRFRRFDHAPDDESPLFRSDCRCCR
jgi:hypothetical protein